MDDFDNSITALACLADDGHFNAKNYCLNQPQRCLFHCHEPARKHRSVRLTESSLYDTIGRPEDRLFRWGVAKW